MAEKCDLYISVPALERFSKFDIKILNLRIFSTFQCIGSRSNENFKGKGEGLFWVQLNWLGHFTICSFSIFGKLQLWESQLDFKGLRIILKFLKTSKTFLFIDCIIFIQIYRKWNQSSVRFKTPNRGKFEL